MSFPRARDKNLLFVEDPDENSNKCCQTLREGKRLQIEEERYWKIRCIAKNRSCRFALFFYSFAEC
jgi:hypothetical protein